MTTLILNSKSIVDKHSNNIGKAVAALKNKGIVPSLKVILVGNNPASQIYVTNKKKACERYGAQCEIISLSEKTNEKEIRDLVKKLNDDKNVHGILIQLPLPSHLQLSVEEMVHPLKDVDGFHPSNIAQLYFNKLTPDSLLPCTPKAVMMVLDENNISLHDKTVCVIGRSFIVGRPLFHLLLNRDATVSLCHSKTKNLKQIIQNSDIIITATGNNQYFKADLLRDDLSQILIDVGMTKDKDNKTIGDIADPAVFKKTKAYTPVPGGIGPLTILNLVQNLLRATCKQHGINYEQLEKNSSLP
jgi:methylenetetrahydrofolate dehydrogenase (NADP+)/methenyltetrahydrofolate cyclohydrolase